MNFECPLQRRLLNGTHDGTWPLGHARPGRASLPATPIEKSNRRPVGCDLGSCRKCSWIHASWRKLGRYFQAGNPVNKEVGGDWLQFLSAQSSEGSLDDDHARGDVSAYGSQGTRVKVPNPAGHACNRRHAHLCISAGLRMIVCFLVCLPPRLEVRSKCPARRTPRHRACLRELWLKWSWFAAGTRLSLRALPTIPTIPIVLTILTPVAGGEDGLGACA